MRLVESPSSVHDEGDAYFHDDDDDLYSSVPGAYALLVEVGGEEEFVVVRSVLVDAGIPFIVKGEATAPDGTVNGPARIAVPKEYLGEARDILHIRIYQPVSELRVKALEMKLFSDTIWSAVWFVAGFGIACLLVPHEWDQGVRFLMCAVAGLAAVPVGNAARRSRRKPKDRHPWVK